MGRVAKSQQQARTKARQRRIAMDYDRAARDKRVEDSAAEAILALGARDDAVRQVRAAEVQAGDALQRIIDQGVKVRGVAQLCDLSAGEVQRLRRAAQEAKDSHGNVGTAGLDPTGLGPAGLDPDGPLDVSPRPLGDTRVRRRGFEETHRSQEQPIDVARGR